LAARLLRRRPTRVGFDIAAAETRVPNANARTRVRRPRTRREESRDRVEVTITT
jgi:hypothetical protein